MDLLLDWAQQTGLIVTAMNRQQVREAYRQIHSVDPLFSPHADVVFTKIDVLGQGGMGVVMRVLDERLGRQAALKLINAQVSDHQTITRFRREASITARLDHPSVPPVYEAGTTADGQHYLLMKVIEGDSLTQRFRDLRAAEGAEAEDIRLSLLQALVKVAEALAYAHSRGVIHRDIKPDNILIGRFGEVMLMDWGLARDLSEKSDSVYKSGMVQAVKNSLPGSSVASVNLTQMGVVLGSPGYMAPEQARGEELSEKADVFALGGLLTEILTGQPAVEGESVEELIENAKQGEIITPRMRDSKVPAELDAIARSALTFYPGDRTASISVFLKDLKAYLAGAEVSVHKYSLWQRSQRFLGRHPMTLLSMVVVVLLVAVTLLVASTLKKAQVQERLAETSQKNVDRLREVLTKLSQAQSLVNRRASFDRIQALTDEALVIAQRSGAMLMSVAKIYHDADQPEAARLLLEEAIRKDPNGYDAYYLLHEIEMKAKGTHTFYMTKALERLVERAKEQNDVNEYTLFAEAVECQLGGELEKAIELYQEILEKYSKRMPWVYHNLGVAYKKRKELDKAMEMFDKALEIDGRYVSSLLSKAYILQDQKRLEAAMGYLSKAKALSPTDFAANYERGRTLLALGRLWEALFDFRLALRLDPNSCPALELYASSLDRLGKLKEALPVCEKLLRLKPDSVKYMTHYASLLKDLKRYEDSHKVYTRLIELEKNKGSHYANRALTLIHRQQWQAALKDYNAAEALGVRHPSLYNNRCVVHRRLGLYDKALADFTWVLKKTPNYSNYLKRGGMNKDFKRLPAALKDFNEALRLNPKGVLALFRRAEVYTALKRPDLARQDYQRLLSLPDLRADERKQIAARLRALSTP